MKYKDIFKKWWFYALVLGHFLLKVYVDTKIYGKLFLTEYIGIFAGSVLGILFLFSIIFLLFKLFSKITKKVTRR